ncbi:MAG: hypothetical protein R2713_09685 [Ilumatobacteraceae bacterium]
MGFLLMGSLLAVTTFLPLFLQVSTGAPATRSGLMPIPAERGHQRDRDGGRQHRPRTGRYSGPWSSDR